MPRKKSAAKKAREAAEKDQSQVLSQEKLAHSAKPFQLRDYKAELQRDKLAEEQDASSSSESEEDDFGTLVTEDVENGLNEVLKAIRSGDERLFDKDVKFFKDPEVAVKEKKDKPIYLNDVLRENMIDGTNLKDESDDEQEEIPYAVQQREQNAKLLGEINDAAESDDDDFLVKKEKPTEDDEDPVNVKIVLPDPVDKERFLDEFMSKHAWLPNKGKRQRVEEDDSEFEDAADTFENAYNFRFEDPNAKEIISYSRNVASMRREKLSKRQRKRLNEKEKLEQDREEKESLIKSTKQKKLNLVLDRLKEIRQAVGEGVSDARIMEVFGDSLMKEDFNDEDWDSKMAELFDEGYEEEDDNEKPTWDDLDEEMAEAKEKDEDEDEDEDASGAIDADAEADDEEVAVSKKGAKKAKKSKLNTLKDVAEQLVEAKKLDILTEVEETRGRLREKTEGLRYKYREVSPESYGLTAAEILNADDKQLGEFISLSKLAPFRAPEKVAHDKRKVSKNKYISQWRKRTFGHEEGFEAALKEGKFKLPSIISEPAKKKSKKAGKDKKPRKDQKDKKGETKA